MANDHAPHTDHAGHDRSAHAGHHRPSASPLPDPSPEYAEATEAFRVGNERMHHGMAVEPSGDVDRDFAAAMLAHHEGAVDMARVELRYGRDPDLRRLAEAIVVAQEEEITMMRNWLSARDVSSTRTHAHRLPRPASTHRHDGGRWPPAAEVSRHRTS